VSLVSILALLFLFKIGREIFKLPLWASLLAVVIFAFGSTAWSYAVTLYQHHVTVFFILSSFYAVWKYKQRGALSWLWASWVWVAYALAISIDYPNGLFLAPIMIYFFLVSVQIQQEETKLKIGLRSAFAVTAILFVFLIGLQLYFNKTEFGSWKTLPGSLSGYKTIVEKGWSSLSTQEINQQLQTSVPSKNVVRFFSEEKVPNSFGTLWFSKDRGILFFSPIFLLGLLGILWSMRKLTLEKSILLGVVAANVFLYSSWGDPWGGWAYGPRYLIPSMSILALFAVSWLVSGKWVWLRRVLAFVLLAYSAAVAVVGVLTTNAVPPRVEADFLHTGFNYTRNLHFLSDGESGSFAFNAFFSQHLTLTQYAILIYAVVMAVLLFLIFVLPWLEHHND
jgi:hypothetical protein